MVDLEKLRMWDDPGETICAEAAAEIDRLTAALKRIDAINDNPARYNGDINDVITRALEQEADDKSSRPGQTP